MPANFTLTIPKPCHEDWRKFTPTVTGGFCQACQKDVMDFTSWTDKAIVQYFEKSKGKTCGRFRESQLKSFQTDTRTQSRWPMATLFAIAALGLNKPAEAKSPKQKMNIEQHDALQEQRVRADTLLERIIITGIVRDPDSVGMPGVNILQKGTTNGTVSDGDGKFMLVIKRPAYVETIEFSFIGMVTLEQQVEVLKSSKSIDVKLNYDDTLLDGLTGVVGGAIVVRRFTPRWFWWKIKGVFSRNY